MLHKDRLIASTGSNNRITMKYHITYSGKSRKLETSYMTELQRSSNRVFFCAANGRITNVKPKVVSARNRPPRKTGTQRVKVEVKIKSIPVTGRGGL
jgi:hypothetical protein